MAGAFHCGRLLPVVALCVIVAGCAPLPRTDTIIVSDGHIWEHAADGPPPTDAPGWQPVHLTDSWSLARREATTEAWYRFTVTLPSAPDALWAVYLPRIVMNAAVYVNGQLVGDGGGFGEHLSRNWNRPLLFSVPAGLLHAGANRLDVRLATAPTSPAVLRRFVLGPLARLRPAFEHRFFLQVTMAAIASSATLVTALLVGMIFTRRSSDGQFAWFVGGVLAWTWSTIDTLVQNPLVPGRLFEWSTQGALLFVAPCLVISLHRALRLDRPRLDRLIIWQTIIALMLLAFAPPLHHFAVFEICLFFTLILAGYALAILALVARKQPPSGARAFAAAAACGLALAAWDVGGLLLGTAGEQPLMSVYIPPIVMVAAGWAVIRRVALGLDEAERLNTELEERVADKARELEHNYARVRELERAHAVTAERDRLTRDMHDGVGGQLVSTLALVEAGTATHDDIADGLRAALDDMRLVIDSLDPIDGDVLSVLGSVRARLEPRLRRHGLHFDWQVQDVPPVAGFGAEQALQVLRIVQEAITNVVKHARAQTITVRTGVTPDAHIVIEIADDGSGLPAAPPAGRGLANMRRRADSLGGQLTVRATTPGTVVHLRLPIG